MEGGRGRSHNVQRYVYWMGHWGIGTGDGDGAHDLLGDAFDGLVTADVRDEMIGVRWRPTRAEAKPWQRRRAVVAAMRRVLERVNEYPPQDVAGAVVLLAQGPYSCLVPKPLVRYADAYLHIEMLPCHLRNWTPGRKARLKAELKLLSGLM